MLTKVQQKFKHKNREYVKVKQIKQNLNLCLHIVKQHTCANYEQESV